MNKTLLICLTLLLSTPSFGQQNKNMDNNSKLEAVTKKLDGERPPMLVLKLGREEVLIEKEDLLGIGQNKILRIDAFERAIQLKNHYAENGAYVVYPRKKFRKELKKKYLVYKKTVR
jgi:hypothetical protein